MFLERKGKLGNFSISTKKPTINYQWLDHIVSFVVSNSYKAVLVFDKASDNKQAKQFPDKFESVGNKLTVKNIPLCVFKNHNNSSFSNVENDQN